MKNKKKVLRIATLSIIMATAFFTQTQFTSRKLEVKQRIKTTTAVTDINKSNSEEDEIIISRATRVPTKINDTQVVPANSAVVQASAPKATAQPPVAKKTTTKQSSTSKSSTTSRTSTSTPSPTVKSASASAVSGDADLLSRLVSAEAAAESFEGKLAVATVILNRVSNPNYPKTISGVILDKSWGYQFTPVADGRINLPATSDSIKAAQMVLKGYRSFSSNILFFVNPNTATNTYVTKNRTFYKTIGNHQFYY